MTESTDQLAAPLLEVAGLRVSFAIASGLGRQRRVQAVDGVDITVAPGETVGLVGESGSGKSTLARGIARLVPSSGGTVRFQGEEWSSLPPAQLRARRRDLQMIFQDPLASLNPRLSVGEALQEPLKIFQPGMDAVARRQAVESMLVRVGLSPEDARRYPRQFSGGQCQRIGIARAMMPAPRLLICDEAVSALDVSIQGQIVNLLLDLQRTAGTAMIFISHNLGIVRHVSHRVYVMFRGRIVEHAPGDALFATPRHPYTRELLAAVPHFGPEGDPAGRVAPPAPLAAAWEAKPGPGCAYRHRCPHAAADCAERSPPLQPAAPGRWAACLRLAEI
jgi:oligopeptide/dipeptide ABC transporter ATP-binding protein